MGHKIMCDLCGNYYDKDAIANHLEHQHTNKDMNRWFKGEGIPEKFVGRGKNKKLISIEEKLHKILKREI